MLSLYTLLLSSGSLLINADTTQQPPVRQIVKLGVHGFDPGLASLSYERQLSAQWSVLGSVSYSGHSYQGYTLVYNGNGAYLDDYHTRRERYYAVGAQLRHYFGSRRPRPLAGWYAAANLQATQRNSSAIYRQYTQQNYSYRRTSMQLQVLAGRQWALGRRLTLDSYIGIGMQQRPWSNAIGSQSVLVQGGLGLQVGYRFRPLPPKR